MRLNKPLAETVQSFRDYVKKIGHYEEALALLYWDLRTGAPHKGVELRSEAIGTLSTEAFRMTISSEMESYLETLGDSGAFEALDSVTQATVKEMKRQFDRSKKIPPERFQAYVVLTSQAEAVWEQAKGKSDFAMFRPYLEQIVDMKTEFIDYWGYQENKYDTLLDMYEPGVTVKVLDRIFGDLRNDTVALVQAIVQSTQQANVEPFLQTFAVDKQRHLSRYLLELMGYDFESGRMDETVHPFMTTINRFDNRITTKFLPNDLRSALFSTIHEGGHALYEQGISTDLIGTPVSTGASMGIHESQSRFWENMIGRSKEFWHHNLSEVKKLFPTELSSVTVDDFYRAVNDVRPSLIRIEADEVTYNLHIMIRYEIEKGLINGDLRVADLPEIWRSKMQDYLGVTPETDSDGVLQDVHWSGGEMGYFPTYSLGNIYAAQFRNALIKDIPDYLDQVRSGNLGAIKQWLNDKIHRYGKTLEPRDIVRRVTGEDIDAKYLVAYFHEKYQPLYGL